MAIFQKIFAYNTGAPISGTTQVGDIAISEANVEYSANFGGLQWWGGPDETLGYVIAHTDPSGSHNGQPGIPAYLGFWRSNGLTDSDFLNLCNSIPPRIGFPPFTNTNDAYIWLNANGYWTSFTPFTPTPTSTLVLTPTPTPTPTTTTTSTPTTTPTNTPTPTNDVALINPIITENDEYIEVGNDEYLMFVDPSSPTITPTPTLTNTQTPTPTPTPTITESETPTPTPTPTNTETPTLTPTNTPTPTATDLSSITTYTISGCSTLNVLVADLGPGALAPSDVFYFDFTGGTPSGCYTIIEKTNSAPSDGTTPLYFYANCSLCIAAHTTPTPTPTNTQTPTPSVTQTASATPTNTPTPSATSLPVTGYGYNLVALPYNFPSSGNSIMNAASGSTGTTFINQLNVINRGFYFNSIDNIGVNRASHYLQYTGQSVTITFTQNGDSAIYSGDSSSFKYWVTTGDTGFVFGTNVGVPPSNTPSGVAVLIQSATTTWVTGATVYVSVQTSGPGVTPTSTPTNTQTPTVTPTNTPTTTPSSKSWLITQCGDPCNAGVCACNSPSTLTVYTIQSVTNLLSPGVTVYADSSLTTTWNGYYYSPGSDEVWLFTNGVTNFSSSCAVDFDPCISVTPTPTPTNTQTPTPTI